MDAGLLASLAYISELWILEIYPSLPHSRRSPPPTSHSRCHLLSRQCWEGLAGGGVTRPSEPDSFWVMELETLLAEVPGVIS